MNNPAFKSWPGGGYRDIASIQIQDEEVVAKTGSVLTRGFEPGLGDWLAVGDQLESGLYVEFIRYIDAPAELAVQYLVRIDEKENPVTALQEVIDFLEIENNIIKWRFDESTA